MSLSHGGFPSILTSLTGSVTAYSLRRVGPYYGPLIKVRRSADDAEQDIGVLNGQLDINSLLTFCGAGSGYISTWYDQSGNGNHATQITTSIQPRIVNSGTVDTQNNKPAAIFTGTEYLNGPSIAWGCTFGVFKRSVITQVVSELTPGGGLNRGLFPGNATSQYWIHNNYSVNGGELSANQPLSAVGSALYQVTGSGLKMTSAHRIGYGSPSYTYLNGCLMELIVYPTDISASRAYIEWNQMKYYGMI